jgi:hypothetical protein
MPYLDVYLTTLLMENFYLAFIIEESLWSSYGMNPPKYSVKIPSQRQFFDKSHTDWPGIETGSS